MPTPFGKTLRKLRIDHSERLLDMAKKLDVSVAFLSSVEIGKRSVPVGLEEKIIELYALDKAMVSLLKKEAYSCRKSFIIKPSDTFRCETVGMFSRLSKHYFTRRFRTIKKIIRESWQKECIL